MVDWLGRAIERALKRKFDLESVIELLLGRRGEEFSCEKGIRLFQFQTWILYPSARNRAPESAGRIAAALILRNIEDPKQSDDDVTSAVLARLLKRQDYRTLFDQFIAPEGGWSSTVLDSPDPADFDMRIEKRLQDAKRVAKLIEFRLRAALNHPPLKRHASASVDFVSRSSKGQEPRTFWEAWSRLKRAAIFNYVVEHHQFRMRPPPASQSEELLAALRAPKIGVLELKRFFGLYAFVCEKLNEDDLTGQCLEDIPRVAIKLDPLIDKELKIAASYNYDNLSDSKATRRTAISADQWE